MTNAQRRSVDTSADFAPDPTFDPTTSRLNESAWPDDYVTRFTAEVEAANFEWTTSKTVTV